ncbi:uncharacterized protein F5147DRAFT_21063 [Suillus discolor]|uniref:DUF6533 domain-containing protein n=1 Tax=Suillus discolor TaxID=1912936 RepID=A0A9P7JXY4_9AGAM|nr:uncharacterized protein F5147DRAFT_21063 [Suillus discolor]KAG2114270.1 hypothetical protein F5147DRAFT_21063 [Suillus discolor]
MTFVSNDPAWWPFMNVTVTQIFSYWTVATGVVVVYDWVLTLGQEIELIWRKRWSFMTLLYLIIRYIGIPYSVYVSRPTTLHCGNCSSLTTSVNILCMSHCAVFHFSDRRDTGNMPSISLTDAVILGAIMYYTVNGTNVALTAMFGVIMIARLYAMYQGSRTMLIFLVIIFLAVIIACGSISAVEFKYTVPEEVILPGTHICGYGHEGDMPLLFSMVWMLNTVWEVLALCLSVWVAVKHFRELRRLGPSTGSTIGDCFRVLIQSHVLYFASFVGVSCLQLAVISAKISNIVGLILGGTVQILLVVQMFVLGPRLILSIREYHAKLVAYSDAETSMNSIVFQERVHVSTSSTV